MASKDLIPDFSTPDKVQLLCETMQKVEYARGVDRAIIDAQFNGDAPYSAEEAEKLKIEINVNWGEGGKILDDANRQLDAALIFKPRVAALSCKEGRPEKRVGYSEKMTEIFNEMHTRGELGRYFIFALSSRNHSLSLHGIGALLRLKPEGTKPRFVALADLLFPTDTDCTLDNLMYFAVNLDYSQGELFEMVNGDEGWDKKAVYEVLQYLQDTRNSGKDPYTYQDNPERWVEWRKQNAGYFYANTDAVPKVQLRMFFYRDPKGKKWYRKVLLRYDAYQGTTVATVSASKTFLYDSKEVFAEKLDQFMHIQYGDSSRVPPLKHHSVRGLGVSLFGPVECMNRVRCQAVQHVFEDLLTWFRVDTPADRDRLKHFVMEQFAVVPRELQIIPKEERYQANQPMLEMIQSQFRQLMNESSASYVRDIESGTSKEMTLGEAQIRLQQVNVQVSSMLRRAYAQELFLWTEQLRRLLIKDSVDEYAEEFRGRLKRAKIPEFLWRADAWRVDIEQVLGAGDQTLAQYQANLLLSQKQWMDPQRQRMVERDWITVTTGDYSRAVALVPEAPDKSTDGALAAQNLFGTLMVGVQIPPREGIDQQGYTEQMLTLMANKVVMIAQTTNMGTPEDVAGLQNVAQDIGAHLAILSQDPENKELVKEYGDALGQLMNQVKAFAQRQEQAMQAQQQQNGQDPKTQAAAQAMMVKAETAARIKEAQAAQKLQHSQAKFELEEARKQISAMNELNREDLRARQEMAFKRMDAALKILDSPTQNGGSE